MKRFISCVLVFLCLICIFSVSCVAVSEAETFFTNAKTPKFSSSLLFEKQLGTGYKNAPTAPVVVGNTLLVASGTKLYKLSSKDGSEIASVQMKGSVSFSAASVLYADKTVFVQLDGGKIQAFDYAAMKPLWLYTDEIGGQSLSYITYDSGYIYTGFWVGEEDFANFVCISTKDEDTKSEAEAKKAKWVLKQKGGFYRVGCAVNEGFVVVGCDDGSSGYTGSSKILSINKENGKIVSSLSANGDIRSSVSYSSEQKSYFVSSKAGYVYKFSLNSSTGALSSLKTFKAPGSVTSAPICHGGRVYFGCQCGTAGRFVVLDAATMKEIYHANMKGYPQASPLVSTGYDSKVYIYMTYNQRPGGITVFEDTAGQTSPIMAELFAPDESKSQYTISPVSAGSDGTLYYKNDSGYIFAVKAKENSLFAFLRTIIFNIFSYLSRALGAN